MALDPLQRPQSVFALHKVLSHDIDRRYTRLGMAEKVRLQLEALMGDASRLSATHHGPTRVPMP